VISAILSSLLAGVSVSLLAADIGSSVKVWNLAPALVSRRDRLLPRVITEMAQRVGNLGRREDPVLWEEICYSLAFHLRAGETPAQAIRAVAVEGDSFTHRVLQKVAHAYDAGTALQVALAAQAAYHSELERIASALEMGNTGGGNIPSLLCHAAETMRRRRLARGELRSKLTEARATAILLSLLPWGIGAFTLSSNSSSSQTVLGEPRGKMLLAAGFAFWAAGNVATILILRQFKPQKTRRRHKPVSVEEVTHK